MTVDMQTMLIPLPTIACQFLLVVVLYQAYLTLKTFLKKFRLDSGMAWYHALTVRDTFAYN